MTVERRRVGDDDAEMDLLVPFDGRIRGIADERQDRDVERLVREVRRGAVGVARPDHLEAEAVAIEADRPLDIPRANRQMADTGNGHHGTSLFFRTLRKTNGQDIKEK